MVALVATLNATLIQNMASIVLSSQGPVFGIPY
jgi:hypothetical protein